MCVLLCPLWQRSVRCSREPGIQLPFASSASDEREIECLSCFELLSILPKRFLAKIYSKQF